ncbi:MAG: hypothetical protein GYB67_09270 [Chloroflexi bacterium]|nr:hypothetical protein [Chloroflexota bacterium]
MVINVWTLLAFMGLVVCGFLMTAYTRRAVNTFRTQGLRRFFDPGPDARGCLSQLGIWMAYGVVCGLLTRFTITLVLGDAAMSAANVAGGIVGIGMLMLGLFILLIGA